MLPLQETDFIYHFSARLKPWVHYVPLAYNAADVLEKVLWLKAHPQVRGLSNPHLGPYLMPLFNIGPRGPTRTPSGREASLPTPRPLSNPHLGPYLIPYLTLTPSGRDASRPTPRRSAPRTCDSKVRLPRLIIHTAHTCTWFSGKRATTAKPRVCACAVCGCRLPLLVGRRCGGRRPRGHPGGPLPPLFPAARAPGPAPGRTAVSRLSN